MSERRRKKSEKFVRKIWSSVDFLLTLHSCHSFFLTEPTEAEIHQLYLEANKFALVSELSSRHLVIWSLDIFYNNNNNKITACEHSDVDLFSLNCGVPPLLCFIVLQLSHFYWGAWGLIQASISDIDYDFMQYAGMFCSIVLLPITFVLTDGVLTCLQM